MQKKNRKFEQKKHVSFNVVAKSSATCTTGLPQK